jgi:hypothetical protein
VFLALLLTAGLCACGGATEELRAARMQMQTALDRQAAAVLDRDRAGYLAAVDPRARGYREEQARTFRNLTALRFADWSYRVGDVRLRGDRAAAEVRLRYRLAGHDPGPVVAEERLELTRRSGRWYVSGEHADSPRQLWEQGRLAVVRGRRSLVLSADLDRRTLRAVADAADRAVPAVSERWPHAWARRLIVEVPPTVRGMGELLSGTAESYEGIAAVTTSRPAGRGEGARPPADRIVLNPQAYELLSAEGRQVVLTHEAAHVATRAHTGEATPMWLSEGLADWFGHRGSGAPPRETAPALAAAVHAGEAPAALPAEEDFAFRGDADTLGRAYEGGWLACRMIVRTWGEDRLMALYTETGGRKAGPRAVDGALREVLGVGEREFTARWRDFVRRELG